LVRDSRHQQERHIHQLNNMKKILTALQIIFQLSFYRYIAIGASLAVGYLSYWLFYQTTTIPMFLENIKNGDFGQYSYLYGITYFITTLLIIPLSGISVAVMIWLFNHSKLSKGKNIGANAGGLAAAMLGMGCPVCGAFLLSLVGVAGGLTVFPMQGLELKFLGLGLLTVSTVYGARKINDSLYCEDCNDLSGHLAKTAAPTKEVIVLPLQKIFVFLLTGLFLLNQFLIGQVTASMGMTSRSSNFVGQLFGIKTAAAASVIAPKLNPDGKTTTLIEQPTISEVAANPNTGDALADAKAVMIPTGKPFYAPDDISFDDPINAQNKWGAYEDSITLSGNLQSRYDQLINTFTCNYCCGGPTNVTVIARCGCRHAKAWRGMFKYMLQNYGDKYTNEQLMGEAYRWTGIWYPKGVLEDYLLATGNGEALGHQTHGGAGADGRHGF